MRAFVLLVLAGGLTWFALRSFGGTEAAGENPVQPGYFLPAEPKAATPVPGAADETPEEPRAGRSEPVPPAAAPALRPAELPEAAATEPALPEPAIAVLDLHTAPEIELASELLHRPQGLERWIDGRRGSMSDARRRLALTFAAAVAGDDAGARDLAGGISAEAPVGTSAERSLLSRCAQREGDKTVVGSVLRETPLTTAASMGLLAREAAAALESGRHRDAAAVYSDLLLAELSAPWKSEPELLASWSAALARAQAGYQWSRKGGWPSIEVTVEKGDSLIGLRKRVLRDHPDLLLSTGLIERVNQIQGAVIQPGQVLRIPTERARVLVDVDAHWVLYFVGELVAGAWEVGVGKVGSETQVGTYTVGDKGVNPTWFPSGKAPIPFGDPENPLGTRWIGWVGSDGRDSGLAFHGTREPDSIGQDQSEGCIRMLNRDVEELFEILPKGATILVQP